MSDEVGAPSSLPGVTEEDAPLFRAAQAFGEVRTLAACSVEAMREISARHGIELATAVLFDRVVRAPEHAAFIRDVESVRRNLRVHRRKLAARLVIVPGAYYREYPEIGADGRILREVAERLHCPMEMVPTISVGGLHRNARMIIDALRAMGEQNVFLLSLSKGGADVKAALAEPDAAEAFAHVRAWVDFCGITQGTPLAGRVVKSRGLTLLAKLIFWLRGHDFQFVRDLAPRPSGPLEHWPGLSEHLRIIHVSGFPLPGHLSTPLLRRHHRRLTHLGPNDGCGLLAHAVELPGLIYPVWGVDHYLRPAWDIRTLAEALLIYLGQSCALLDA